MFMQGKVEICGVNTAQLPVLKSAETRALLERARAGDAAAREKLILPICNNHGTPSSTPQLKVKIISDYVFEE